MSGFAEIDRLLLQLEDHQQSAKLSLQQLEKTLGQIKVQTRNPSIVPRIATEKGVKLLSSYGFDRGHDNASLEALRCLANTLLQNEPARQILVRLDYAPKAAALLNTDSFDEEFLAARIIFLLTYKTDLDFKDLIAQHDLASSINGHLSKHAEYVENIPTKIDPMEQMALVEILKLLFNLTYKLPETVPRFDGSVRPLVSLLTKTALPTPPLQQPIVQIINALLNLLSTDPVNDTTPHSVDKSPLNMPVDQFKPLLDRLVTIFDGAIKSTPEPELEQAAAPLCTLLRQIYKLGDPESRTAMQQAFLPQHTDREQPLGQSSTFPSRLLRLSNSTSMPTLSENISNLLFELSDKDPEQFIRNIGYGFASGFLMSHQIEIPVSSIGASSAVSGGAEQGEAVNPITGQTLSAEARTAVEIDDMTEEEREREAERLFVLFERLKATGVVDVKNPVEEAFREGRFEEIE